MNGSSSPSPFAPLDDDSNSEVKTLTFDDIRGPMAPPEIPEGFPRERLKGIDSCLSFLYAAVACRKKFDREEMCRLEIADTVECRRWRDKTTREKLEEWHHEQARNLDQTKIQQEIKAMDNKVNELTECYDLLTNRHPDLNGKMFVPPIHTESVQNKLLYKISARVYDLTRRAAIYKEYTKKEG